MEVLDTVNLYVSSIAPEATLANNNSRLTINLNSPIIVPKYGKCRVLSSTLWYDTPNIEAPNNGITFTYAGTVYNFVLADGLYSVSDISERIKELLENASLPPNIFELVADEATSKLSLKINQGASNFLMNMDLDNPIFKDILGFTGILIVLGSSVPTWYEATNKAKINKINSVLVHCSFASGSVLNGNSGADIISEIHLNSEPNNQIITKDIHPSVHRVTETQIDSFTIFLTTEDGFTPIKTNEPWTLTIELF